MKKYKKYKLGFFIVPFHEDEEDEIEYTELEHGFASESIQGDVDVKPYNCPRCNRKLFDADVSLHGVIFIRCRRCMREVVIETTPTMRRIGFIDTLQRKENTNNDSRC